MKIKSTVLSLFLICTPLASKAGISSSMLAASVGTYTVTGLALGKALQRELKDLRYEAIDYLADDSYKFIESLDFLIV